MPAPTEQEILNESLAEKEARAALGRLASLRSEERHRLWLEVTRILLIAVYAAASGGSVTCREALRKTLLILK